MFLSQCYSILFRSLSVLRQHKLKMFMYSLVQACHSVADTALRWSWKWVKLKCVIVCMDTHKDNTPKHTLVGPNSVWISLLSLLCFVFFLSAPPKLFLSLFLSLCCFLSPPHPLPHPLQLCCRQTRTRGKGHCVWGNRRLNFNLPPTARVTQHTHMQGQKLVCVYLCIIYFIWCACQLSMQASK